MERETTPQRQKKALAASEGETPRLVELVRSLSLASEIVAGVPPDTTTRAAILALRLAEALGFSAADRSEVLQASLLHYIGSSSFAFETARAGEGEDMLHLARLATTDGAKPSSLFGHALKASRRQQGLVARVRSAAKAVADPEFGRKLAVAHCEQAVALASSLGLGDGVPWTLGQAFERWAGRGHPRGLTGDELRPTARVIAVAFRVELTRTLEGNAAVVEVLKERSGGELDPHMVAVFARDLDAYLHEVSGEPIWERLLALEPRPFARVGKARIETVAEVCGEFVDYKCPYTLGHSLRVAELAAEAGVELGLQPKAVEDLRLAGLLHDLGRVAVPNGIWDKPEPLSPDEWDRVRQHARYTEYLLACSPSFAELAGLAAAHHERLDAHGYHRTLFAAAISPGARVLAAADVFSALREERPHRRALSTDAATVMLVKEMRAGRLDREAVDAVLAASARALPKLRTERTAGLSERGIEVLRLVAQGLSPKEIAARLLIAQRTAESNVALVCETTGVSTRAAAARFVVRHHLFER